jgi:2-dehydropantoate 2-reductase
MNVLVQGVGGVGGVMAARLAEAGVRVTPVTGNEAVASALNRHGFHLEELSGTRRISLPVPASPAVPGDGGPYDVIVVATQSSALEQALRASRERLAPGGAVVCVQNGLPEERAAAVVPPDQVLGCVVSWGASMTEPGRYVRTSSGALQLGRLDGRVDSAVSRAEQLLRSVGEVRVTTNLSGVRWSKLALNSAITTLGAVGGERLGVILRYHYVRRLMLEIITELVNVAKAKSVRLEKVSGTIDLESIALPPGLKGRPARGIPALLFRHAVVMAVGFKYRRLRSSMLYALERGRPPEVDHLNGEIVRRAEAPGLDAPVNRRLVELVHQIARGEKTSRMRLLEDVYQEVVGRS